MEQARNEHLDLGKLFLTFVNPNELPEFINFITNKYTIVYSKIFVLESTQTDELICTYNIDTNNMAELPMDDTILVHRKKDFNVIYTINSLNMLIKSLNNNVLDVNYRINWKDYTNCILLTNGDQLRRIDTKIHKIINLS